MVHASPTVSHSFTMRVRIVNKPGMLAHVLNANQINNLLASPGIVRGALNARAPDINEP